MTIGVACAACSARTRLDVASTTVAPSGRCDTARVVEFGATLPLSGPSAPLGREYRAGLELAVRDVNRAGGALGTNRCVELVYKDDRGDGPIAGRAVADLADDEQVAFLAGPVLPGQVRSAGAALRQVGIPAAGFSGLDATFRRSQYPWVFPVAASNGVVATTMVSYASSQHWARIGLVSDGAADQSSVDAVRRAARRHGIRVVGPVVAANPHGAAAALARLRRAAPDGLVVVNDTTQVAQVLRARAQDRWTVPVVAGPAATDASVVTPVGRSALVGVAAVVPQALVVRPGISSSSVRRFRDELRRERGGALLDGSIVAPAQAYDAVLMMASSANSVHSTSPTSVRAFLESAGYVGLLASYSYTGGSHSGIPADQLSVVPVASLADGLFVPRPARP